MGRWELPGGATFSDILRSVEAYARPLRRMWPSFWLKAAAVRDGDTWQLCVFSLVGRWNDEEPVPSISETLDALAIVSKRLDANSAWTLIRTMRTKKVVQITDSVCAVVPNVNTAPSARWQERAHPSWIAEISADVTEHPTWWYLEAVDRAMWLDDIQAQNRIDRAIRPDLERLSEQRFESFISSHFAGKSPPSSNFPSFTVLNYSVYLPLALQVDVGIADRSTQTREISIACRAPINIKRLQALAGEVWSSTASPLPVKIDSSAKSGWSYAHVNVPITATKLWVDSPNLYRHLAFEIARPAPMNLMADALAYMYAGQNAADRLKEGIERWTHGLLHGSDAEFEVALLNTLTRLGIPVLFGGRFKVDGKLIGPETEGFDLLALHPEHEHAVVISAKGTDNFPKGNEINATLRSVDLIQQALLGWTVYGLIACHAPASLLSQFAQREDIKVWGATEMALLLHADHRSAITRLLWMPPWVPVEQSYQYYLWRGDI